MNLSPFLQNNSFDTERGMVGIGPAIPRLAFGVELKAWLKVLPGAPNQLFVGDWILSDLKGY